MKMTTSMYMRIIHRYLGFFLAGIMAMYAISGVVLIFRNTDFLKKEVRVEKQLPANVQAENLGKALKKKNLKVEKEAGNLLYFKGGTYDKKTGMAVYSEKKLPFVMGRMTKIHKATSSQPLFLLNVIFGLALLFYVVSAFWMFSPKTTIFKKGIYFTLGGMVLTLILLFV